MRDPRKVGLIEEAAPQAVNALAAAHARYLEKLEVIAQGLDE